MERTFVILIIYLVSPCSAIILDNANLQALNREVRTVLLQKIANAISSASSQMGYKSSQTQTCESLLSGRFDSCKSCVSDECDLNFQNCHEKKPVTLCDVTGSNYKVCRAIMNSESLAIDLMEDFDNKMRKVMRRMVQDQETHVLTFIRNLKSFADTSLRSQDASPIRKSLKTLIQFYDTVKASVDGGINHNVGLQNSMNSMSKVMEQGMQSVGVQMSSTTGRFMTELAFNLARMLATYNPTFGRKKRQATTCSRIPDFPSHCFAQFSMKCSCSGQSPAVISEVCGAHLRGSVADIVKPVQVASEIFDKICVQRNLIEKVNFENVVVDIHNLGYRIIKYNAIIRDIAQDLTGHFQLKIFNLPETANEMATAIWNQWIGATVLV
ncbi:uncharacterized protein [Argopecten irradians]|uniref:uncharacterized protein n=1 Tax=Argopecten irradians TaxID=31199 RepID=UPI003713F5E1